MADFEKEPAYHHEVSPEWFKIPRKSPAINVEVGEFRFRATYNNTSIYVFAEPWAFLNHVFVISNPEDEEEGGNYIFNSPDLIQVLIENDFPAHWMPFPSNQDLEAYVALETQELEEDE